MKKILRSIVYSLYFFARAIRLRIKLLEIDKKSPFKGPLGLNGVYKSRLTHEVTNCLKNKYRQNIQNSQIVLEKNDAIFISNIFTNILPVIKEYLGNECFLDGINWMVTNPNQISISESWHTDNVGNRLKCFICVEGDGTIPTLIISSKVRIPGFFQWFKYTLIESLRWAGLNAKFKLSNIYECKHNEGSIYIFDTQLLHRGSYEYSNNKRIIFHMEFSNPNKHKIAKGPIGTFDYNSFKFSKELFDIASFSALLDKSRCKKLDTKYIQYSQKF